MIGGFYSCSDDKDDDNQIKIEIPEIEGSGDEVKLIRAFGENANGDMVEVASAEYKKGFSFSFPKTLDNSYLTPASEDLSENLEVSDRDVKVFEVEEFIAFDEDGDELFELEYSYIDNNIEVYGIWIYCDRNVTIKGEEIDEDDNAVQEYDLNLKKGWNMMYMQIIEEDDTYTYIHTYNPKTFRSYSEVE